MDDVVYYTLTTSVRPLPGVTSFKLLFFLWDTVYMHRFGLRPLKTVSRQRQIQIIFSIFFSTFYNAKRSKFQTIKATNCYV